MDHAERSRLAAFYEERLRDQEATHPGWTAAFHALCPVLLAHGGALVVPPAVPDPLVEVLRRSGSLVPSHTTVVVPGETSDSHRNVARLWRTGAAVAVGTGYALTQDDLWRSHSWAWSTDGRLVETTSPHLRYFGIRLEGDDADWFADRADPRGEPPPADDRPEHG